MAQRVCIAQALARQSRFLIADEPVTGLDPGIAQGILEGSGFGEPRCGRHGDYA